jgi:hypothetical protein
VTIESSKEALLRWFDERRSRYLYKAADALVTSTYVAPSSRTTGGSPTYKRGVSISRATHLIAPGLMRRTADRILDENGSPFAVGPLELLGYGSGATVFQVQDASRHTWALKIFRKSLGRRPEELRRQLANRRATHETVTRWYSDLDIVPPSYFLLLHGPVLSLPAVGCLQPMIPTDRIDLLYGLSEPELLKLVSADANLGATVRSFIVRTLRAAHKDRAAIDLVGRDNVVLVPDGVSYRLVLLDLGIYRFDVKATRNPDALARLHDQLHVLERLERRIAAHTPVPRLPRPARADPAYQSIHRGAR